MDRFIKYRRITGILLGFSFMVAVVLGVLIGFAAAGTRNYQVLEEMDVTRSALPTQIFDIKGRLITEFFSDEKREIVSLDVVPQHLINALITREDQDFYDHKGFKVSSYIRAFLGYITGNYQGGGSTLTAQVAGTRHANRQEITIRRKLIELWYAVQMESRYSKNEILEFYMNEMPFGGGTNGVEAASDFYFRKSVKDISLAEAVLLALTLSAPNRYSPFKNPTLVQERQRYILDEMVKLGYAAQDEADLSYRQYWDNYSWDRYAAYGAWSYREDKAPWFSEYIRILLGDLLLGSQDIYRGGMKVYTTLDLDYQRIADQVMQKAIKRVNQTYQSQSSERTNFGDESLTPLVDLFSLSFNLEDVRVAGSKKRFRTEKIFNEEVNPIMDLAATLFNIESLKEPAQVTFSKQAIETKKTNVEGALVAVDIETGHILAMVGGKEFSSGNQFNRAVQGGLQPGSAFKPIYYSAALEQKLFTPASLLTDRPTAFENDDGTTYIPANYGGRWRGEVRLREALALSMNIPSLKILQALGFDATISRASRMLGISDPEEILEVFPRKIPLGLGICKVSPIQMARAFATFANQGREVEPIAIRYIQDRNGRIILEPEKEAIARRKRPEAQIMSPQVAFMMANILQSTVNWGTLAYAKNTVEGFDGWEIAGKTGTTENWGDAWTIGFTSRIASSIWFGFDSPGNSLGRNQTGARAAGPVWAEFMKEVHEYLPKKEFEEPKEGLALVEICRESGLLPSPEGNCKDITYEEYFLKGTEPTELCKIHEKKEEQRLELLENLKIALIDIDLGLDDSSILEWEDPFSLDLEDEGGTSGGSNPLLD